jgi:hypothetical protein
MAAQAFFVLRLPSGAIGGVGFGRLTEKLAFHILGDVVMPVPPLRVVSQYDYLAGFTAHLLCDEIDVN